MATMNVSIPGPMREWVDTQVKGGEYANASDYIRDLIRRDRRRHEELRAAIAEGLDSGRSVRKAEDVMKAANASPSSIDRSPEPLSASDSFDLTNSANLHHMTQDCRTR